MSQKLGSLGAGPSGRLDPIIEASQTSLTSSHDSVNHSGSTISGHSRTRRTSLSDDQLQRSRTSDPSITPAFLLRKAASVQTPPAPIPRRKSGDAGSPLSGVTEAPEGEGGQSSSAETGANANGVETSTPNMLLSSTRHAAKTASQEGSGTLTELDKNRSWTESAARLRPRVVNTKTYHGSTSTNGTNGDMERSGTGSSSLLDDSYGSMPGVGVSLDGPDSLSFGVYASNYIPQHYPSGHYPPSHYPNLRHPSTTRLRTSSNSSFHSLRSLPVASGRLPLDHPLSDPWAYIDVDSSCFERPEESQRTLGRNDAGAGGKNKKKKKKKKKGLIGEKNRYAVGLGSVTDRDRDSTGQGPRREREKEREKGIVRTIKALTRKMEGLFTGHSWKIGGRRERPVTA